MHQTILQIGDYQINVDKGSVQYQGQSIKIRPKTFALLLKLIKNKGAVVTKGEILASIWGDVTVDEQIIFQSIKELRKIFKEIEPIRTMPRQGYIWTEDYQQIQTEDKQVSIFWDKRYLSFVVMIALLCAVGGYHFLLSSNRAAMSGSVLVLPVKSRIKDNQHQWVRFGAMDMVIRRLQPSQSIAIYQPDDVLDVLRRAKIPVEQVLSTDSKRIFAKSGANMIVQIYLDGSPKDYQLHYTFIYRHSQEKGVFLGESIENLLDNTAQLIAQKIGGQSIKAANPHSDFTSALLSTALEYYQQEDFLKAEQFFQAVLASEPDNRLVHRLLAQAMLVQGKKIQAEHILQKAMMLSKEEGDQQQMARIRYWQATTALAQGRFEKVDHLIRQGHAWAKRENDWLYLGYFSELKGHVQAKQSKYDLAAQSYNQAIAYHDIIECPYGKASNLLNLARLSQLRGMQGEMDVYTNKAQSLIRTRTLTSLEEELKAWTSQ